MEVDIDGEPTIAGRYPTRNRSKMGSTQATNGTSGGRLTRRNGGSRSKQHTSRSSRSTRQNNRRARVNARLDEQDGNYEDDGEAEATSSGGSADGSVVEEEPEELEMGADADGEADADAEGDPEELGNDGKPYALRQRAKINYAIPPPLEEMKAPPPKPRSGGRSNGRSGRSKAPGWSATGAELSRWMGGGDDSVSEYLFLFSRN